MSYYEDEDGISGLGALAAAATFPVGQQLVAGYLVASNATAAEKLAALNAAMTYGFRGNIVRSGWGGPGAPGGVPAGSLWIIVEIRAPGVTGATMNTVFSNVGQRLQSQLPGSRVTNTHASTFGAAPSGSATSSGGGSGIDLTSLLSTIPGAIPGAAPAAFPGSTDPATGMPYYPVATAPDGFFTQTVGGIPTWALLAGGVLALGAVGYVVMSKPKPAATAAVKANRRRRSRRGGFRRRSR
jgi:hypothetical protein